MHLEQNFLIFFSFAKLFEKVGLKNKQKYIKKYVNSFVLSHTHIISLIVEPQ